jgi:hypothetical protein
VATLRRHLTGDEPEKKPGQTRFSEFGRRSTSEPIVGSPHPPGPSLAATTSDAGLKAFAFLVSIAGRILPAGGPPPAAEPMLE